MALKETIKNYILESFLFTDDPSAINDDDSFLDKGIIDSTGIMEVIFFIEDECSIKVKDEEMITENLDSINSIVRYVENKQKENS